MMYTEDMIDEVLLRYEGHGEEEYAEQLEAFSETQPIIFAYLMSDNFKILTQAEREFQLYLALIVWETIEDNGTEPLPIVEEDAIGAQEEVNWELLSASSAKMFKAKLDVFFDQTKQEDLLAYVEDALIVDAEDRKHSIVTKEGREVIFITLKTIVDLLTV